jgi:hypothetical protein
VPLLSEVGHRRGLALWPPPLFPIAPSSPHHQPASNCVPSRASETRLADHDLSPLRIGVAGRHYTFCAKTDQYCFPAVHLATSIARQLSHRTWTTSMTAANVCSRCSRASIRPSTSKTSSVSACPRPRATAMSGNSCRARSRRASPHRRRGTAIPTARWT